MFLFCGCEFGLFIHFLILNTKYYINYYMKDALNYIFKPQLSVIAGDDPVLQVP